MTRRGMVQKGSVLGNSAHPEPARRIGELACDVFCCPLLRGQLREKRWNPSISSQWGWLCPVSNSAGLLFTRSALVLRG
jgi:hypothetical protein